MLNQKKIEIFLVKTRKSPAMQFLEIAFNYTSTKLQHIFDIHKSISKIVIDANIFTYKSKHFLFNYTLVDICLRK